MLFECRDKDFVEVPDGTLVNPFLNPKDRTSGLPWDTMDGLSVAAGQINACTASEIHVHLHVSMVTVLVSGSVVLRMKDPGNDDPPFSETLEKPAETGGRGFATAAVLALPGTFLQLDNRNGSACARVLYLTTPGYVFEPGEKPDTRPAYDDAITLGHDWDKLAAQDWNPSELHARDRSFAARRRAVQRLARRSRREPVGE